MAAGEGACAVKQEGPTGKRKARGGSVHLTTAAHKQAGSANCQSHNERKRPLQARVARKCMYACGLQCTQAVCGRGQAAHLATSRRAVLVDQVLWACGTRDADKASLNTAAAQRAPPGSQTLRLRSLRSQALDHCSCAACALRS
eukprot:366413-Chlamydomonas_euryale.AAC.21